MTGKQPKDGSVTLQEYLPGEEFSVDVDVRRDGVANVQFKRAADGVFKLLEVNPRYPGTLPLTAAAGVDMPKLMMDEAMGRPVPDRLMPFKELMVVRYWTERYFDPREWKALCRPQ